MLREKIQSGRKKGKRFEDERCINREGQIGLVEQLRYITWRGSKKNTQCW